MARSLHSFTTCWLRNMMYPMRCSRRSSSRMSFLTICSMSVTPLILMLVPSTSRPSRIRTLIRCIWEIFWKLPAKMTFWSQLPGATTSSSPQLASSFVSPLLNCMCGIWGKVLFFNLQRCRHTKFSSEKKTPNLLQVWGRPFYILTNFSFIISSLSILKFSSLIFFFSSSSFSSTISTYTSTWAL